MAKPSQANTARNERVADAILDIINARPRSPTRAELMAALAGWEPTGTAAKDTSGPAPWRPSELGERLMDGLPRWAAAVHADCGKNELVHPARILGRAAVEGIEARCRDAAGEMDAVSEDIIKRLIRGAFDASLSAGNVGSHLVDLALVVNMGDDGRTFAEMDGEQMARRLLVLTVLAMAGLDAGRWTLRAHLQAIETREAGEAA